jgi:hypothetical protein
MSSYTANEMWKAKVSPWAKVGLLALSECSAGSTDGDEHSTFMFEKMYAFQNLTGYTWAEAEAFLVIVLDLMPGATADGFGVGSGIDYSTFDVVTRAEHAYPVGRTAQWTA